MQIAPLIQKIKAPLSVLAAVLIIDGGIALRRATDNNTFNDARFNQQLWIDSNNSMFGDSDEKAKQRASMVDDIMRYHLKVGMSKTEVEDLLGPASLSNMEGNDLSYFVGPRYKQNTDSALLVVIFDDSDKLESAVAGQDENDLFGIGDWRK